MKQLVVPYGKRWQTKSLRIRNAGSPLSLEAPAGRSCIVLASAFGNDWGSGGTPIDYDGVLVEIFGVIGEFRAALLVRQQLGTSLPPTIAVAPVRGAVVARYSGGMWWDAFLVNIVDTKATGGVTPKTMWTAASDELPLEPDGPWDRYVTGTATVDGITPVRILEGDPSRRRVQVYNESFGSTVRVAESAAAVPTGVILPTASPYLDIGGTAELWSLQSGGEVASTVRWISEHVG